MTDILTTDTPVILHNPKCSTSRHALAIMKASGENPTVIEYLKTPLSKDDLVSLIKKMQISPRELIRQKESLYTTLNLDDMALSDDALIEAMIAHPILINRPIVMTNKGAALCRPLERVFELLDTPIQQFTKENRQVIYYPNQS